MNTPSRIPRLRGVQRAVAARVPGAQNRRRRRPGAPAWLPRCLRAGEDTSRDVIVLHLPARRRGRAVAGGAVREPAYYALRPTIAVSRPDTPLCPAANRVLDLNGFFGLAPAMCSLLPAYQAGHLLVIHATGSTDPSRSHFRRAGVHGSRRAGRGATSKRAGWGAISRASRHEAGRGAARPRVHFGPAADLAGAPNTLPIPNPANFGLSWQLLDPLAAAGVARDVVCGPARPAQGLRAEHAAHHYRARRDSTSPPPAVVRRPCTLPRVSARPCGRRRRSSAPRRRRGVRSTSTGGTRTTRRAPSPAEWRPDAHARRQRRGLPCRHGRRQPPWPPHARVMSEFGRKAAENASFGTDHGPWQRPCSSWAVGQRRPVDDRWPGMFRATAVSGQESAGHDDYRDILAEIVLRRLGNSQLDVVFPVTCRRSGRVSVGFVNPPLPRIRTRRRLITKVTKTRRHKANSFFRGLCVFVPS